MSPTPSLGRVVLVVCALASAASADRALDRSPTDRPQAMYIRIPSSGGTSNAVSSRLVFLHRCPVGAGCALKSGTDDSRTAPDTSSIVNGQVLLGEFTQSDEVWAAMVQCVKDTMAPFDIQVTDVDPGSTPHYENMVGGKPQDLGRTDLNNAGGVSPFTCGEIPNSVSFTFDVYGADSDQLCWTAAQEVAHGFGLDHEYLQKDPMTYIAGSLPKRFRDVGADCGEFSPRACSCPNRAKQNSYRMIVNLFGPGPASPPTVNITSPTDGKEVQPGFRAVIQATDDVRVTKIELYADGTLVGMTDAPVGTTDDKFYITGPTDLSMGSHVIEARAYDVQDTTASSMITIDQGPPCTPDKGCTGTDVCVDGVCLPGPDQPGGLGSKCQLDAECLSLQCTDGGEDFKHCTETCDPNNKNSCPSNFECLASGATGVCWPSPDSGCCDAGTSPQGPLLLGVGVLALVLRRRRASRAQLPS